MLTKTSSYVPSGNMCCMYDCLTACNATPDTCQGWLERDLK